MLYNATAIDPLPSAHDGGHEAVSAMEFSPPYVRKTEKVGVGVGVGVGVERKFKKINECQISGKNKYFPR